MGVKNLLIWGLRREQVRAYLSLSVDETSQIDRFNDMWADAYTNVPFYAEWKSIHRLPDRIGRIKDLVEWPILSKRDLILNPGKLVRQGVSNFHESVTGGATGEPLHFRTIPAEAKYVSANKWFGWAKMGVYADSRCYLLWGHRHFYGNGLVSNMRFKIRQCKDWLTNNKRMDATDLSNKALEQDVKQLISFRPECVIAYSASLLALVRSCSKYRDVCRNLGIRAVICTAGPLTNKERGIIADFFDAPVGMEYGSMEGGVIAYLVPDWNGRYHVFNKTHIVHVSHVPGGWNKCLVTKLYKGYLPLIRYDIGDYLQAPELSEDGVVKSFSEVLGRAGDDVDMGNGIRFHGQSFMTCAEGFDQIIAYQIRVNRKLGTVTFVAQTTAHLGEMEKAEIKKRAAHMSGLSVESIQVVEANNLEKAPSGKIRLVVED